MTTVAHCKVCKAVRKFKIIVWGYDKHDVKCQTCGTEKSIINSQKKGGE